MAEKKKKGTEQLEGPGAAATKPKRARKTATQVKPPQMLPPWRVLLPVYRRMEARGELRGGRFVGGFVGEQFALPEAVEALRAIRRAGDETETVILSAADPLNLVGIIVPGPRVSPFSTLAVAYRNGALVDVAPLGTLRSRLWGRESAAPVP